MHGDGTMNIRLISLVGFLVLAVLGGVAITLIATDGASSPAVAQNSEPSDCEDIYDWQCLGEYRLCLSSFAHIRAAETRCEGKDNLVPVDHCIVSAGYDQQIYTSAETS